MVPFSARDVARATKLEASKIRTSALSPDFIEGLVTGQAPDGRYLFKRDDWASTVKVRCVPGDAKIPYPSRQKAYCEDGSVQKLFLRWHRRGIRYNIEDEIGLSWPMLFRDPGRANGTSKITFNPEAANSSVGPAVGPDSLYFRQEDGVVVWAADVSIYVDGTEVFNVSTTAEPNWGGNFFQWDSLTVKDGIAYVLHSYACMAAIRLSDGVVLWDRVIFSDQGIAGGEFDGYWETNSDIVIIGDRAVALGYYYQDDSNAKILITVDADTGLNLFHWRFDQDPDYLSQMHCWQNYSQGPAFWVSGDLVCFTDYSGRVVCFRVNADKTVSTEWHTDFPAGGEERRRRILGFAGGALICAYEYHEWEEVEDALLLEDRWDAEDGTVYRWTYRDPATTPVGVRAGVEALSLVDGSLLGDTSEPGNTDWETWIGPQHDYFTDGEPFTLADADPWYVHDDEYAGTGGTAAEFPRPSFHDPPEADPGIPIHYCRQAPNGGLLGFGSYPHSGNTGGGRRFRPHDGNEYYYEKGYDPLSDPAWLSAKSGKGSAHDFTHAGPPSPGPLHESHFHNPSHPLSASAAGYIATMNTRLQAYEQHWIDELESLATEHRIDEQFDHLVQCCERIQALWFICAQLDGGTDLGGFEAEALTYQDPPLHHLHLPDTGTANDYFVETAGTDRLPGDGPGDAGPAATHAASSSVTITQRYHWRHAPERDIQRTPTLPLFTGCSCQISELLVVAGRLAEDGEADKLEWRAYNAVAEEQWRYTIQTGEDLEIRSAPFVSNGKIHTHIRRDGQNRLITLDPAGLKLSEVICPDLRDPTFDGVSAWISHDGESKFG